jgi:hypothetical protein
MDSGKKINGRKRFIVTDTMSMLITAMVCAASVQDRDGAKSALLGTYLSTRHCRLVFADAGFAGRLVEAEGVEGLRTRSKWPMRSPLPPIRALDANRGANSPSLNREGGPSSFLG